MKNITIQMTAEDAQMVCKCIHSKIDHAKKLLSDLRENAQGINFFSDAHDTFLYEAQHSALNHMLDDFCRLHDLVMKPLNAL